MANLYDLKKFDLNLLVIFECIYQHLSISKAAAMLFITPSAVSQSLQRLRQQLNDPLFVRVGKGMTPTTACVNLHYHLQQNLEQLEKTINLNNRSELRKRIVIYGPPLFCSVNSHVMINQLCHQANLQIEHHNLTTTESAEELLAYRQADLVFTRMPITNRTTICQPYQTVQTLAVCRAGHPRRETLTSVESLAQEFFTHYITNDPVIQRVQQSSIAWLNPRNIAFRSDSFMTILNMINKTDLIGFLPSYLYDFISPTMQLHAINIDNLFPDITIYINYHHASSQNYFLTELITILMNDREASRPKFNHSE